jgi:thiamine pyrophosphokinase
MRAVILANGQLPDPGAARRHIQSADRLICADGGTQHAIRLGLVPDIVVGDLDSIEAPARATLEAAGVRFEAHPVRKDKTDLELALGLAIAEGAMQVDLLATLGGRLDQSLANLLLLTQPEWATVSVRVIEGSETAWVVRGGQTARLTGNAGDTLSLVPLTPQVSGVNLTGVEWPLANATLQLGSTLTISNTLADRVAQLQVAEGLVLVVHRAGG